MNQPWTIVQSTPQTLVWVAIDVAKDRHEALIEAPGLAQPKEGPCAETRLRDFRSFAAFLHILGSQFVLD